MDLLFDLDGTLIDPDEGITRCIAHALAHLGRPSPAGEELRRFIGPPLHEAFVELLGVDDRCTIDRAVEGYRRRFSTVGLYETRMYAGVPDGLAALRAAGHRLFVTTSKPWVFARRIVAHFGLASFFEETYGSELDGLRVHKTDLLAYVIERERLDPRCTWMIGDRANDIAAGRANKTGTIGVLWGYGTREELAGADVLAESMATLTAIVEAVAERTAPSA